ncbi:asparagine synthase-related protein [Streptomyces sp. NPDC002577]
MMAAHLPAVTGFLIRTGAPLGAAPRFAAAGPRIPVDLAAGRTRWTGHLVAGGAADDALVTEGGLTALVAGELYNRTELADALGDPGAAKECDARLLLALYGRYGVHAFRLLNGRFAALVADGGRLVAATDHVAGLSLYVTGYDGGFTVATEAKALLAAGPAGTPLAGLPAARGPAGLHRVPAGHAAVLGAGAPRLVRTWAPPAHRRILGEDEAVRAVRTALDRAVRARLGDGDGEVTAVLSGGIDSSSVAALAAGAGRAPATVTMGTDTRDEFTEAALVARHLGTEHTEIRVRTADLLAELPWTVWASESTDPDVVEYLLPLAALYRRLPGTAPRRILTGYGADIPLGGMHRAVDRLPALDDAVAHDMDTFDGLSEMVPALSGAAGHWTTHPYWDRDVLDLLTSLEAGLKRRHGRDKWVLREAMADALPAATVARPKLGVHEGSGATSSLDMLLAEHGLPAGAKTALVHRLYDELVVAGRHPDTYGLDAALVDLRSPDQGPERKAP